MSASRHRQNLRSIRQAKRAVTANTTFDTAHVSIQAGREWVRHGGNIETFKKAWPVRNFKAEGFLARTMSTLLD